MHDLRNRTFDRLTVLGMVSKDKRGVVWLCRCDCGRRREVLATRLINRAVRACAVCSGRRGGWRLLLAELTPEARAYYEEMIERRRRIGMRITGEIHAEAVDVAYREYAA